MPAIVTLSKINSLLKCNVKLSLIFYCYFIILLHCY